MASRNPRGFRYSREALTGMSRVSRRRVIGLAGASVGSAALLAACKTSAKPAGQAGGAPSAASTKPKYGGTVTARVQVDPFDYDPTTQGIKIPNFNGMNTAFETLLSFQYGPKVPYAQLTVQPGLATKWESPDPTTYTFHLRPGVKFANLPPVNGRELTSADIKWTYEYESRTGQFKGAKPAAQNAWMFEGVNSVQTPDATTVTVHFAKPFAPFVNYAASDYNPILPHEVHDQYGNFSDHPIGTGAYQLDIASSQKGSHWVWKKNPTYWDAGKPYIDEINWLVIADDATAAAAAEAKQLDMVTGPAAGLTLQAIQQVQKVRPDVVVNDHISVAPEHLYMMVGKPPLNDLRIRQAISYSIDRDEFVKVMTEGKGNWALAGAFPDTFSEEEIHKMLKYDPTQAKQLLSAAGYANGLDLEFLTFAGPQTQKQLQELFQAQLAKTGLNIKFDVVDKPTWIARKVKHDYTLAEATKMLAQDVDAYVYAIFYPGSVPNYGDVNDPQLTPLLDQQRAETDPAKRNQIIRQAVQRINVDEVWALALYYPSQPDVWAPRVQNYAPNFAYQGWPLVNSWLSS